MPAHLELTAVTVAEPEPQVVDLEVEVAAASVRERVRSVLRELSREASLPGFRKGKAPKELVRRMVGADRIRQEVTESLIAAAYDRALADRNLKPLERASVELLHYAEDEPLRFKARVTLRPEVTMPDYLGLELKQPPIVVPESEIDEQLERIREQHALLQEVERPARNGDVITAELTVRVEDEAEPRVRELGPLELGAAQLVPTIDEHLLNLQVGDRTSFPVVYPSDYNDESLRDKRAEFTVVITSVKDKILPEVDDELARTLSEVFETLDELKTRIHDRLRQTKEIEARTAARKELERRVVEEARLELSESWIERRVQLRFQSLIEELTRNQLTLDEFLTRQALTADQVKQRYREEVVRDSRRELVLQEIARRESIELTTEELEHELLGFARATAQDPGALAERLARSGALRTFEVAVFERKVGEWLLDRARIVETEGDNEAATVVSPEKIEGAA